MATAKQFEDLGVWPDARAYLTEKEFTVLRESAAPRSRRLAKFIRYLETDPSNTRVRKPAKH